MEQKTIIVCNFMIIIEKQIAELKVYEKNARTHPEKQIELLCKNIEKFGFTVPLLLDKDNVVIAGHGRILAMKRLNRETVPCVIMDNLTEEEVKALRLADNKLAELSDWNMEIVIDELKELNMAGFDLTMTGFDGDLILEPEKKDEELPESPDTLAQPGDIWQLGRHRIMCGDSTDPEAVARLMNGERAAMVWTDPPYNVDYGAALENAREGIMNDSMSKADFRTFLDKVCANLTAYSDGGIYICMSSSELDTLKQAFEENGGHWQNFIVWVKNTFTLGRCDYQHRHEPILYGWPKGVVNHYFIQDRDHSNVWEDVASMKTTFDGEVTTIKIQGITMKLKGKIEGQVIRKKQKVDIWRYDKPSKSTEHPTMKPIALVTEAIINSSQIGQIVMDLFLGGGSAIIACEKTNRSCYGMELDPHYLDVCIKRWEEFSGCAAEKIG
jgi:DNA modification methylase